MSYRKFDWNRARSDFATLFTDFFSFAAGDWVITTVEAGTGTATEALTTAGVSSLLVTNAAGSGDSDEFQWAGGGGAVKENVLLTLGKKLQFVARFKVDDAELAGVTFGLCITDTTLAGGVTDGIFFRSAGDSKALVFAAEKDSVETTVAAGNLADDTWTTVEFYYDGADRISAYRDGVRVGSVAFAAGPDDEALALSFGVINGSAAVRTLEVDYIGVSQQR